MAPLVPQDLPVPLDHQVLAVRLAPPDRPVPPARLVLVAPLEQPAQQELLERPGRQALLVAEEIRLVGAFSQQQRGPRLLTRTY